MSEETVSDSPTTMCTNAKDARAAHLKSLYRKICAFEKQVSTLVAPPPSPPPSLSSLTDLCTQLPKAQDKYTSLLRLSPALGRKYDLEHRLWASATYPLLAHLRRRVQHSAAPPLHSDSTPENDTSILFNLYATTLQSTLTHLTAQTAPPSPSSFSATSSSIPHAQPSSPLNARMEHQLGDVARYLYSLSLSSFHSVPLSKPHRPPSPHFEEQASGLKSPEEYYLLARRAYMRAWSLCPHNAHYMHSLAVLSSLATPTYSSSQIWATSTTHPSSAHSMHEALQFYLETARWCAQSLHVANPYVSSRDMLTLVMGQALSTLTPSLSHLSKSTLKEDKITLRCKNDLFAVVFEALARLTLNVDLEKVDELVKVAETTPLASSDFIPTSDEENDQDIDCDTKQRAILSLGILFACQLSSSASHTTCISKHSLSPKFFIALRAWTAVFTLMLRSHSSWPRTASSISLSVFLHTLLYLLHLNNEEVVKDLRQQLLPTLHELRLQQSQVDKDIPAEFTSAIPFACTLPEDWVLYSLVMFSTHFSHTNFDSAANDASFDVSAILNFQQTDLCMRPCRERAERAHVLVDEAVQLLLLGQHFDTPIPPSQMISSPILSRERKNDVPSPMTLVLDTNILLNDLQKLDMLYFQPTTTTTTKTAPAPTVSHTRIVIPLVVVTELQGLAQSFCTSALRLNDPLMHQQPVYDDENDVPLRSQQAYNALNWISCHLRQTRPASAAAAATTRLSIVTSRGSTVPLPRRNPSNTDKNSKTNSIKNAPCMPLAFICPEDWSTLAGVTCNDDAIICTCLSLVAAASAGDCATEEGGALSLSRVSPVGSGSVVVCLVTRDRGLRIKAMSVQAAERQGSRSSVVFHVKERL